MFYSLFEMRTDFSAFLKSIIKNYLHNFPQDIEARIHYKIFPKISLQD